MRCEPFSNDRSAGPIQTGFDGSDGAHCAISQRREMIELDAAFKQSRTSLMKQLYASGTQSDKHLDYRRVGHLHFNTIPDMLSTDLMHIYSAHLSLHHTSLDLVLDII